MKAFTVGIHQPNFMPWMGFFNKIYRSDIFVIIDEVQFVKGSVCNRTKIKNNVGQAVWLTVPVVLENGVASTFNQTKIADVLWYRKALNMIKASYIKSPYYSSYYSEIEEIVSRDFTSLATLNIALIKYFCEKFLIQTPIYLQSEMHTEFGKKNYLNLGITKFFEGKIYLSGNGAKKYNDHKLFEENNIIIEYLDYMAPPYHQFHGDFLEGLSVLDLLFNEGEKGVKYIVSQQRDLTH